VQVAAIEAKYGAPLATSHPEDLKAVYGTFVEAVIPPGDAPLTGREPQLIQVGRGRAGCMWEGGGAVVVVVVGW
jgi:hypothetical protein